MKNVFKNVLLTPSNTLCDWAGYSKRCKECGIVKLNYMPLGRSEERDKYL